MSAKCETRPRLLFVVNAGWFFISHRLPIARAARDAGFEVHVATHADGRDATVLASEGVVLHNVPLERGKLSLASDLRYLVRLARVMRNVRADIVHNVTVKPVLYGTIAARALRVTGIVNALSGLGYSFASESRWALAAALKIAFRSVFRCPRVLLIVQNADDQHLMVSTRIISAERIVLIRGSGVDLREYPFNLEAPNTEPLVLLPARLLRDKGIREFAEASALLAGRGCGARFAIAGRLDESNPAALSRRELDELLQRYPVKWLGQVEDMPALYREASVVCLPTYYREGLPKALLEACACGRAIVTTDVPGCREVVEHEVNGLLIPVRDAHALADALQALIDDPERRARFGLAGRKRVEEQFGVERVIAQTIALYSRALGRQYPSSSAAGVAAAGRGD
jgi:glycosyltransferase involved in cell wall biosynthesis